MTNRCHEHNKPVFNIVVIWSVFLTFNTVIFLFTSLPHFYHLHQIFDYRAGTGALTSTSVDPLPGSWLAVQYSWQKISRFVYHEGCWPRASTLSNPSLSVSSMSSWAYLLPYMRVLRSRCSYFTFICCYLCFYYSSECEDVTCTSINSNYQYMHACVCLTCWTRACRPTLSINLYVTGWLDILHMCPYQRVFSPSGWGPGFQSQAAQVAHLTWWWQCLAAWHHRSVWSFPCHLAADIGGLALSMAKSRWHGAYCTHKSCTYDHMSWKRGGGKRVLVAAPWTSFRWYSHVLWLKVHSHWLLRAYLLGSKRKLHVPPPGPTGTSLCGLLSKGLAAPWHHVHLVLAAIADNAVAAYSSDYSLANIYIYYLPLFLTMHSHRGERVLQYY